MALLLILIDLFGRRWVEIRKFLGRIKVLLQLMGVEGDSGQFLSRF
jgi:hypothetical protein